MKHHKVHKAHEAYHRHMEHHSEGKKVHLGELSMKSPKEGHSISDHGHPEHRGPHHDKYIHKDCQVSAQHLKGDTGLGDKSKLDSLKGEPHGADITGHNGKMHW